jgi:hypothetical protein
MERVYQAPVTTFNGLALKARILKEWDAKELWSGPADDADWHVKMTRNFIDGVIALSDQASSVSAGPATVPRSYCGEPCRPRRKRHKTNSTGRLCDLMVHLSGGNREGPMRIAVIAIFAAVAVTCCGTAYAQSRIGVAPTVQAPIVTPQAMPRVIIPEMATPILRGQVVVVPPPLEAHPSRQCHAHCDEDCAASYRIPLGGTCPNTCVRGSCD